MTANARDQFLHLTAETAGNGMVTSRSFSPKTGRVSTIQAGADAATANFSYQFDLVGNLTQRVDEARAPAVQPMPPIPIDGAADYRIAAR